jgi:L-serine dehydratase
MEFISVFDIFKIGIGPSSSHTMGPWRAAQNFIKELEASDQLSQVKELKVELYGSLAKTGVGHGTVMAILLGLSGHDPVTIPVEMVKTSEMAIRNNKKILLGAEIEIDFNPTSDVIFYFDQELQMHANGMIFRAFFHDDTGFSSTWYSVGGGFVIKEGDKTVKEDLITVPFTINTGEDLKNWCSRMVGNISDIVMKNELHIRTEDEIRSELLKIWETMKMSIFESCKKSGVLPGGLGVTRRSGNIARRLLPETWSENVNEWIEQIKNSHPDFRKTIKWLSCFALAVNEENAAYGRIVTAPTNGAAGVIPAVLMFHTCFNEEFKGDDDIVRFLLTAGEIGGLFKKGATISAAMGGCQAEIGVSSSMAAAALTECLGGDYEQSMMAAEIAMEHHLGMTCDPVGGLVQVPCIERNSMGAIKAITASQIALYSNPADAKVSLDWVIKTMKETAADMNTKYKETADGGLALSYPVNLVEC